jgi:hypothetical protein
MSPVPRLATLALLWLASTAGTAIASPITPGPASLRLVANPATVGTGTSFTVDVLLDATGAPGAIPGLYGGQFVIDFDPAKLRYDLFTLAPGVSFFSSPVTGTSGGRRTVTLGIDNGPGNGSIGTFTFTALGAPGVLATIGLADADDFFGTFISYVPTYQPFYPTFAGTQVSIVPAPAAGWLLGTALTGLVLRRRARAATAA